MLGKKIVAAVLTSACLVCMATPVLAGHKVYEDPETGGAVKIGGRIQIQYHYADPEGAKPTDEVIFRRLRSYLEGSFAKDWNAKFQFEFGKANGNNEVSVQDAYFQYKGFKALSIKVGAVDFPFAREYLTSSKKQQLVERTFVGDSNYGVPSRQMGIVFGGHFAENSIFTWGAALSYVGLDPDDDKVDFDLMANKDADFNEGWMIGGRLDFHPLGVMEMAQGDFERNFKVTIGIAAFNWANDDDNNTYSDTAGLSLDVTTPDMDSVTGFEISGAIRGFGVSVDGQYNLFNAATIDPSLTSGLFVNGDTGLSSWSIEGGYMVWPKRVELVTGYQVQDADGYGDKWTRLSFGVNCFMHQHNAKLQFSYRIGENLGGKINDNADELFLQSQFVF